MAQHRYWDYGSPIPQYADNFVNRSLNDAGVYEGLDLTTDVNDNLVLTVGYGLQPDGIIWDEDADRILSFSPPGAPTNYTVVATHEDEQRPGGSEVEYDTLTGIVTSVTDGIPLGWIYHPGGGVPLTPAMIQNVVKAKPQEYADELQRTTPTIFAAEFVEAYHDVAASGINTSLAVREYLTTGQFLVYQAASNSASAPGDEQLVQHFTILLEEDRVPVSIELYIDIPNSPNNNLTTQIYGTDQVVVPLSSGSTLGPTTGWETKTVEVQRGMGTWANGTPWELRFLFNMDPGQSISLGRVKVNFWPYN